MTSTPSDVIPYVGASRLAAMTNLEVARLRVEAAAALQRAGLMTAAFMLQDTNDELQRREEADKQAAWMAKNSPEVTT